jgi:hypothetical protein
VEQYITHFTVSDTGKGRGTARPPGASPATYGQKGYTGYTMGCMAPACPPEGSGQAAGQGDGRYQPVPASKGNTSQEEYAMSGNTQDTPGTAPAQDAPGTTLALKPHERFIQSIQRRAEREGAALGRDVSMTQIDKVLTAETEAEVWDADEGGTFSGQDMIDVELQFVSITMAPSSDEYDATLGVYANIRAVRLDTGEEIIVNTGADKIITKLLKFESMGNLPISGVIRGVKTKGGVMLKLRPIPARAIAGTAE